MNAKERSDKYATHNTDPTMTDQSGAADTDINLIVKRYGVYGTAPGASQPGIYGDFSDLPTDLAERIQLMRRIPELKANLPKELADLTIDEIVNLTPDQLKAKLQPPAPTPANDQGAPQT